MLLNCGVGEDSGESWSARRSNQSILKKISPEYSLEGLMLKLELQYFGHLTWRTHLKRPWCSERLKAGEVGERGWDGWMASPIQCIWVWAGSGSWWWTAKPGLLQSMGLQWVRHDWATQLNWWIDSVVEWIYRLIEYADLMMQYSSYNLNSRKPVNWIIIIIKKTESHRVAGK